ncbi:helix-turn-helix transcriptional regulator [Streptomyces sp. SBST2-5]|uniref:Helix-turn-helix transcriptional regulator n=1 Tax=Streptomyces composti TaxID=2720025 RepID=A0ABX1A8Y9_9ACTN|nr:helix-turn-helix domain-containing protein [Streptomyces composti]NJP51675.1 helix-turn-helix transcriptional regulator [Streptomyces composti]
MVGVAQFDRHDVLLSSARTFAEHGFEACSVNRLVDATGLQRGSLYGAFGSKAGLFREAFKVATETSADRGLVTDLLIVALRERAATDPLVAEISKRTVAAMEAQPFSVADQVYSRLLQRAGLTS